MVNRTKIVVEEMETEKQIWEIFGKETDRTYRLNVGDEEEG